MVDVVNINGSGIDGAKIATADAVYRDAFPAYRVFIYYHEITADVTEVRVNNAGGSAERTASSASITFLNPQDRYTVNTVDAMKIGAAAAKLNDRAILAPTGAQESQFQYDQLRNEVIGLAAAGNIGGLSAYLAVAGLKVEDFITSNTATGFSLSNQQPVQLIDREAMIAGIMEAADLILQWKPLPDFTGNDAFLSSVKYSVMQRKLAAKTTIKYDLSSELLRKKTQTVFDYPLQKGDCIFHPMDPVRIAFRDPFDARMWYWRFSGFVDTWTESSGTNKESSITINCTDVTKMARYTYSQINTGILDDVILPNGNIDVGNTDNTILFYKELFAGFQIYEVLEILFFGVASLDGIIDIDTRVFIAGLSDTEAANYLLQKFGVTKEYVDLQNTIKNTEDIHDPALQKTIRDIMFDVKYKDSLGRLPTLKNVGIISLPNKVSFRRKSAARGVNIYVYGETDDINLPGAEHIKGLKEWNEVIHHRVRRSDLDTMSVEGDGLSKFPQVTEWDMDKIITVIGTNEQGLYPVGSGRVFYLTSSGLTKRLGNNAIDRGWGGDGSMHSEFVDNLSFIYNMAENIEYCFYATPKGDVVFEMPFYDFDAEDFEDPSGTENSTFDSYSELVSVYDQLFREAYSGVYNEADLGNMTNLMFKATSAGSNYVVLDYFNTPVFNYLEQFTIEGFEQYGYTNSNSDLGVYTVARCSPHLVPGLVSMDGMDRKYARVMLPEMIKMLGLRVLTGTMLGFITDYSIARNYLALQLNKINGEARNLSVSTTPKFGLMVNRPLRWRTRTYSANIVNLSDSIVWNSSCETTVNMNQIRGWTGEVDDQTGRHVLKHFGGDRPFDLAKLLKGDDEDKQ